MIPTINNAIRVKIKSATTIKHIFTNTFIEKEFENRNLNADISNHFAIISFKLILDNKYSRESGTDSSLKVSKNRIKTRACTAYESFVFLSLYDKCFRLG